ncbi:MAG: kelch repeat-containing protein [Spirosomataceae bacterium]
MLKGYVGFGSGVNGTFNDLWEYNPVSDTWKALSSCPQGKCTQLWWWLIIKFM